MSERTIKHMAFAVNDVNATLKHYQDFVGVGLDAEVHDYQKSRNRVAIFNVGDVEYQLCQSLDAGGRFDKWITERGNEGLHHICYTVDDIDKALAEYDAFEKILIDNGAQVFYFPEDDSVNMDSIYCRDAAIATSKGLIICNMG